MTAAKVTIGASLLGITMLPAQPVFAETTGVMEPLSQWAQLGVCGVLGAITWTAMKMMDRQSKRHTDAIDTQASQHAAAIDNLADAVRASGKEQAKAIRDATDRQNATLSKALFGDEAGNCKVEDDKS